MKDSHTHTYKINLRTIRKRMKQTRKYIERTHDKNKNNDNYSNKTTIIVTYGL